MKISIITAVYARAATIGQAIDSVSRQSHRDIEHIIIDGASPDGTMAVVRQRQHARMTICSEPDEGIYDALNKGVARATGDVIGVVHSDDFLAHDSVLSMIAAAFADPRVDAVYGDLVYVPADDPSRTLRYWRAGAYSRQKLAWGWMPPHPALFLRKEVFARFGGYDKSYEIAADYDAILRYFGQAELCAVYIPQVIVKMRFGGESNRSPERLVKKMTEDYRALRANRIGGFGALAMKNFSKLPQFFVGHPKPEAAVRHDI